ncbi:MAG: hypothetical protein RL095_3928, partial [Verrucomicrobiota bacterium]
DSKFKIQQNANKIKDLTFKTEG